MRRVEQGPLATTGSVSPPQGDPYSRSAAAVSSNHPKNHRRSPVGSTPTKLASSASCWASLGLRLTVTAERSDVGEHGPDDAHEVTSTVFVHLQRLADGALLLTFSGPVGVQLQHPGAIPLNDPPPA